MENKRNKQGMLSRVDEGSRFSPGAVVCVRRERVRENDENISGCLDNTKRVPEVGVPGVLPTGYHSNLLYNKQ